MSGDFTPDPSWPSLVELATEVWGQPNQKLSGKDDIRWGHEGGRHVTPSTNTWKIFEPPGGGGGYVDMWKLARGNAPLPPRGGHKTNGAHPPLAQDKAPDRVGLKPWEHVGVAYPYRDATGGLILEAVRMKPPWPGRFMQRCPNGERWNGETQWKWSVKHIVGHDCLLYRLPELLASAGSGVTVFVVEGEKDADNLAALGLIATTNIGGAGKWRADYAQHFAGRHVVVLPDNDEAGEAQAHDVATSLHGVAASLRVYRLPGLLPKGDVSDWLADGGTRDELLWQAREAPLWEPPPLPSSDEAEAAWDDTDPSHTPPGGGKPPDPPPPRDDTGPRPEPPPVEEEPDWPEPVDFEVLLAGGGEATADHMPPSLWPYIQDTAERMGVALSSVALAVMVTCSSAISEEWQIQPKQHDPLWTEQARLWGAIVGPPSIKKSPIISEVTKPIVALDAKAHGTWGEAMKDYKAKLKEWKKGDQGDEEPVAPRKDRYLVENATIEALSEVLRDDAGGKMTSPLGKVLVRQDELSEFLANLDKYTPNGKGSADRGSYLRLYNGGRFSIDRIIRGSFVIPNWSGCLLGGIQPEPIQRIATEADNDGMLQRFMFDVPPPQSDGVDRAPDWPAIYAYRDLFPFLAALRPGKIKYGEEPERIAVTGFHVNAYAAQDDVRALIKYVTALDSSKRLESAAGKWGGLFARLCLTFHLVEIAAARSRNEIGPHPESVSADIAERVRRYMREVLAPHLMRADALMFNTEDTDHAAWVAGYILARNLDKITARDIVQDRKALRAPEKRQTLYSIMSALSVLGWVEAVEPRNPSKPPNAWMVNPRVHLVFAKRAETERARRAAVRAHIEETIQEAHARKSDAEPEC